MAVKRTCGKLAAAFALHFFALARRKTIQKKARLVASLFSIFREVSLGSLLGRRRDPHARNIERRHAGSGQSDDVYEDRRAWFGRRPGSRRRLFDRESFHLEVQLVGGFVRSWL